LGCLTFIILAALGLLIVLVLGPVFIISDAIKWLLAGLYAALPWVGGVAFVVLLPFGFLALQEERKWKRLHKTGSDQEKREYWALLNKPDQNLKKESYLKWLHQPANAEKLGRYEEWKKAERERVLNEEK